MDDGKIIYKRLPPTSDLVELLTLPRKKTRWYKWNRILLRVIILAFIAMIICVGLIKSDWLPKHEAGLLSISFMGIAIFAWLASVLIDIVQSGGTLLKPAKELAEQFDRDMARETQLLPSLQAIPVAVLTARHQRLESQLQAWEKWLDAARLMGLLGPPFIFLGKGIFGNIIPLNGAWIIEVFVSAFLTGVLLGAISFRSGMKSLHRVSSLLKRSSEQHQAALSGRRRRMI